MTASTSPSTPNPGARVLAVGECNPFGGVSDMALYHLPRRSSGNRLRCIMGLSDGDYLRHVDRANLCSGRWSVGEGRRRAAELLDEACDRHARPVFVLLGVRVAAAFLGEKVFRAAARTSGDLKFAGHAIVYRARYVAVCLPHPSGRCRRWNAPGAVAAVRTQLTMVAPEIPWGLIGDPVGKLNDPLGEVQR